MCACRIECKLMLVTSSEVYPSSFSMFDIQTSMKFSTGCLYQILLKNALLAFIGVMYAPV